jgi:DNA polymerase III delta prime subunit
MHKNEKFEMIKHAFESGKPAHGYLITGPLRGVASEMAISILQYLFCQSNSVKPCGACDGCRKVREKTQVDIEWIYPEKKSRIISMDNIRKNLLSKINQSSMQGGWKAGVIVGADRLNTSSSNAFLKTLEEPPDKTIFLLLTEAPQQLLPTIISRCQRIDLDATRQLDEPWRGRVVETLSFDLYHTPIERLSMSNYLLSIIVDMKNHVEELVRSEENENDKVDESKDVFLARVSARYREFRGDFSLTMLRWFRDIFILCSGGDSSLVYNQGHLDILKERASNLDLSKAIYNLKAVEELTVHINERNMPEESSLAYAIDRIQHGVLQGAH